MATKQTTKKAAPKKTPPAKAPETGTAVVRARIPFAPEIERLYGHIGINETTWPALLETMFPDVTDPFAITLALSYASARKLDPFKVKIHIVPFRYRDKEDGNKWKQRWQIINSIGDLRATAFRTGEYAGKESTTWGPVMPYVAGKGIYEAQVHSFCQITVKRIIQGEAREFEGPTVWFEECVQLKKANYNDDKSPEIPNSQWQKRPNYMLEKCAEAAALRVAFPEELSATYIHEEMDVEDHAARFATATDITPDVETGATKGNGAAGPHETSDHETKDETERFQFVQSDGEIVDMEPEAFATHVQGLLGRIADPAMIDALWENNGEEVERLAEAGHPTLRKDCEEALAAARQRTNPKKSAQRSAPGKEAPSEPDPGPQSGPAQGDLIPDEEGDDQAALIANISDKIRATETVAKCDAYWKGVMRQNHPDKVKAACREVYSTHRQSLVDAGKV